MNIRLEIEPNIERYTTADTKELISSSLIKYIGGVYIYAENLILINLGSLEFKVLEEEELITHIGKVIMHELMHSQIHEITRGYADDYEEKLINNLVGL